MPADQESLTELLCNIISPIGLHRTNHSIPSKGKKDKKRKRALAIETLPIPVPPTISSFVVVGLNNIVRRLASISHKSKPQSAVDDHHADISLGKENKLNHRDGHFAAILVVSPFTPPIVNSMLPQLVFTASLAPPELHKTRLVQLPKGCEGRFCQALGVPRVSCIGILEGAPQMKSFMEFIRERVPEVKIPWLEDKMAMVGS